jgi:hypothetical protein
MIISYDTQSTDQAVIQAYKDYGQTDTAAYLQAIESIMAPHLGSTGEGPVTDATELTQWIGQLLSYGIENAEIIRGVS